MSAHRKSSLHTTSSQSHAIKRYGVPHSLINPGTRADNVIAIVECTICPPLPVGYREIEDIVRNSEKDAKRAAALSRARQRLAEHAKSENQKPTLASLRLNVGLSQAKVAELLGNSQSSYSLIESGRRKDMMLSTIEKLTNILQVSITEVIAAINNSQEK